VKPRLPLATKLQLNYIEWQNRNRLKTLTSQVAKHSQPDPALQPVILFNASSRITGISLNASFSSLVSWSLRLAGVPVIHFVCQHGMAPCMLGTNREEYSASPPCQACISQSDRLFSGGEISWFTYQQDPQLSESLSGLDIDALVAYEYALHSPLNKPISQPIPLGSLATPSVRWALRRHSLPDDEKTRYLLRSYMLSAASIASQFFKLTEQTNPSCVILFNGSIYPEATVSWIARRLGIRVVTHEVGFQAQSTFFTDGEATAYPIDIPGAFELNEEQNKRLDTYLEKRFQGQFTMAGIQFWPEMNTLDEQFLATAAGYRQIVPIFTNVAYDTSQVHASVVFPSMFSWLDLLAEIIREHPDTLFIIRAHPDEMREGTAKLANESVQDWVEHNRITELQNVVFISPTEYISSYDLIKHSKFVIVYNSSIGLEATLLGKVVVCGGKARYTQYPIVHFPPTPEAYREQINSLLSAENIDLPPEFLRNARRFLYYQLYRTSLPLNEYIEPIPRQGFVKFKSFSWDRLIPDNSRTLKIIYEGIMNNSSFLLPDEQE